MPTPEERNKNADMLERFNLLQIIAVVLDYLWQKIMAEFPERW